MPRDGLRQRLRAGTRCFLLRLAGCCLLAGTPAAVASPAAEAQSLLRMPRDMARTDLSLMTVGLGEEMYTRFGHTIIRIDDHEAKTVQLLNWGLFDFSDPDFNTKFFQGILIYRMGAGGLQSTLRNYRLVEKRKLWQQRINLTSEQKQRFLERVFVNGLPENRSYRYQYTFNNCSTVIRDYFDELFGGAMKARFSAAKSGMTFRERIYGNLNRAPVVSFFLDVVMNSRIDAEMSQWEEMFLPDKLSLHLKSFPSAVMGPSGAPLPFLSEDEVLVDNPEYPSSPVDFGTVFLVGLLVPLIGAGLVFGPGLRRFGALHGAGTALAARIFGLALAVFSVFAVIFGWTMTLSWGFSEHLDLKHNLNLILFWPTDLLLLVPASFLIGLGRLPRSPRLLSSVEKYCGLHLLGAFAYFSVYILGATDQDIRRIVMFVLPVHVLCLGITAKLARNARVAGAMD